MTSNKAVLWLSLWAIVIASIWGAATIPLNLFIVKNSLITPKSSPYVILAFLLALIFSVHLALYYCSRYFLGRKLGAWGASLQENGNAVDFKGRAYLFFYSGFIWRTFVIYFVIESVIRKLKDMLHIPPAHAAGMLHLIGMAAMFYLSILWLVKAPAGNVKLTFAKDKAS